MRNDDQTSQRAPESPYPGFWERLASRLGLPMGARRSTSGSPSVDVADAPAPTAPEVRSEARLEPGWRVLVDAMPDAAVVLDKAGFIVHFNPPLADLFPRARIGHPVTNLTRSPALLAALDGLGEGDRSRIIELEDRVPVVRHWTAIATGLSMAEEDMAPRYLVVLRDLTEQQRHAQLRTDFIAHASHELRTPLASLKSMVETMQGPARDDAAARDRFLAMMQTQASRMSRLIDDLLNLSRAEMRAHVSPTGAVDLGATIAHVVELLEPLAQGLESTVTLVTDGAPVWVRGDREDLTQIFQNLLQNALKYGRDGGEVRIEFTRLPSSQTRGAPRIAITVVDQGDGIAPEHLPRLTERFYRVSVTTSRNKGGTGLGLAIVKHLVARHRGELKIASRVGEGSRFTVELDLIEPPRTIGATPAVGDARM